MNHQFTLKNNDTVIVRKLTIQHVDELVELQQQVIEGLSTESFLQPLTIEEFQSILNGKGILIGAFVEERVIAFRGMLEPELDEEHLGRDAGLSDENLHKVLYSEVTTVHPDYQGNGLQVMLGKLIMQEVDEKRFSYICATVAPFNIPSLKDKFALGMHIVALKEKYGKLLRYVLIKELTSPLIRFDSPTQMISMSNTEHQQELLTTGWVGTELTKLNDEWVIQFNKK